VASERPRLVYKYFDLADRFVRVRVVDPAAVHLSAVHGLNRQGWRRAVIRACIADVDEDLDERLAEYSPRDPRAAEDLLYQLAVAVNPGLDIHAVALRPEESPAPRLEAPPETASGEVAWLQRLRRRAAELEERLERVVIGQPDALASVAAAVTRAAAGLAPEGRPLGCFLFVGRTGTGKTELAKALARELYGPSHLVRVDCTEFAQAHEYSKLIGAPPGYVGHEDGGVLTEALRKRPESVVLFDEIEKAHPKIHHILLQVLDEGRLTDNKGRTVSFERALIVLTSNAGAREVESAASRVGFAGASPLVAGALREITDQALGEAFTPEFLGRIDERVLFRNLTAEDARAIAALQLAALAARARRRGVRVAFAPGVAELVARRGFSPSLGAREITSTLRRAVEAALAAWILTRKGRGGLVRVGVRAGRITIRAAA
jgi:ATP-dependent Clp protease ATP-binding subunit ClpA